MSSVKRTLPQLSDDLLKQVAEKLQDIGVEAEEDLALVTEADLTAVLKPIVARKLLHSWSGNNSGVYCDTSLTEYKCCYTSSDLTGSDVSLQILSK